MPRRRTRIFEVNPPLLSRSTLFRLDPLDERGCCHAVAARARGRGARDRTTKRCELLVERSAGDGRHALTSLEVAVALARRTRVARRSVSVADVEAALGTKAIRYGRDDHYDVISAFIKSMRGSDPDATLYWLAHMLEAGEDARFIARRMVILASEDVGMADPNALLVADAAARAVEFVGLPEAQLNLAHAVVYLATAPKSNRVISALGRARRDVTRTWWRRGARSPARRQLPGGGELWVTARATSILTTIRAGWVDQQYRPDAVDGSVYYEPSGHGFEAKVADEMRERSANNKAASTACAVAAAARRHERCRPRRGHRRAARVRCVRGRAVGDAVTPAIAARRCARSLDVLHDETVPLLEELRGTVRDARRRGRASRPAARCRRDDLGHGRLGDAPQLSGISRAAAAHRRVLQGHRSLRRSALRAAGTKGDEAKEDARLWAPRPDGGRHDPEEGVLVRGRCGVGLRGAVYVYARVREVRGRFAADRLADTVSDAVVGTARTLRTTVREAVAEGRDAMHEAETEIRPRSSAPPEQADSPAVRAPPVSRLSQP